MAVTGILAGWSSVWDDGDGGESGTLIINLETPSDVLAQISLHAFSPSSNEALADCWIRGYIAGGHYFDATNGGADSPVYMYINNVTSVWFTAFVVSGDAVCLANICTFD